ncbi:MAG: lytic murein transglycosylase [Alphaproteobacteria bacterium]|nr:MAG: lytic murein transglycosylase [Alphaproteobacteria bacterium]
MAQAIHWRSICCLAWVALVAALFPIAPALAQEKPSAPSSFAPLLGTLWPEAAARGVTRKTFDAAFAGLTPDPRVAATTRRQPEYGAPVGRYIDRMASPARIANAMRKAAEWARTLDAIEAQYGVDRWIVVALWGIETSFGSNTGGFDVIRSLATLALSDYRPDYFRDELLAALTILQQGHVARATMQGSWAGAMGQPQFMPSNFLTLAVDFDRDGRKDIWGSVPDVLASIANFLKHWGWKPGAHWAYEVTIPQGFDHARSRAGYSEWAALGVMRADGAPLPDDGNAILLFPSGAAGPAFLVGENFEVIKRYNNSDVFALAAGHLADRARGRGPLRTAWPAADPQLSRDQRIALQKRLKELGHPVNDLEGRIDFDLRDEIRREQMTHGMVPDGHPTRELLKKIGALSN